jgi:hypothetical protein
MSVRFYQFGTIAGGTDSSGNPINPSGNSSSGAPEQFEGTLGAGTTTITFSKTTIGVTLRNTHDSLPLEYSFDNIIWFTAIAYQVIQENVQLSNLYLRSPAGAPTYEVIGILS